MNDADDNDLGPRLRAIDRPRPFDADAFAERVIAEGSRRRKRRVAASCVAALTLAASGLVWHSSHPVEPQRMMTENAIPVEAVPNARDTAAQRHIDELDALLRHIERQQHEWERLDRLAEQLARTEAALAAARREQQERQLALFRAELSAHVEVPDLTRLYVDPPDDAPL